MMVRRAIVSLFAVVLAPSACGGDGVTMKAFLAEANAVCEAAGARLDAVVMGVFVDLALPEEPDDEDLMLLYGTLVAREAELREAPRDMMSELRGLDRPADSAQIAMLFDDIEQRFDDEWEILVGASQTGDAARVQWDRDGSPFQDLNVRARDLGLTACVFD